MDPLWAQVGITAILVGVTIYYAYQVRKSNKNIWKLEEARLKKKKMGLRKVIPQEIYSNDLILNRTKKWIENRLKDLEKPFDGRPEYMTEVPKFVSSIKGFPETAAYRNVINELGALEKEEIRAIMCIYEGFEKIKRSYKEYEEEFCNRPKASNLDIKQILEPLNEIIAHTINFCEDLEEFYQLLERENDEEKLKNRLKNILSSYRRDIGKVRED